MHKNKHNAASNGEKVVHPYCRHTTHFLIVHKAIFLNKNYTFV